MADLEGSGPVSPKSPAAGSVTEAPKVAAKTAAGVPAVKSPTARAVVETPGGAGGESETSGPNKMRRRLIWTAVWGYLAVNFLMFLRFFFPRALFEPSTVHEIGSLADYSVGVSEKYKQSARIWVVKETRPAVCDFRALYPSRLHTRLEAGRKQVQVPVSRKRLHARRHQFRRSGTATHGSSARRIRPDGADYHRHKQTLFLGPIEGWPRPV